MKAACESNLYASLTTIIVIMNITIIFTPFLTFDAFHVVLLPPNGRAE